MAKANKEQLTKDIREIAKKAAMQGYMFTANDAFSIGYMAAKYGLDKLIDNQEAVIEACRAYDVTDDLGLLDTIGETLIDLQIITNDGRI